MTAGLRLCGFFCFYPIGFSSEECKSCKMVNAIGCDYSGKRSNGHTAATKSKHHQPKRKTRPRPNSSEARSSSNQKTIFYKKSIFLHLVGELLTPCSVRMQKALFQRAWYKTIRAKTRLPCTIPAWEEGLKA